MLYITIIGILGSVLILSSYCSILHNIHKTKKTNNFTFNAILIGFIANLLLLIHSFYRKQQLPMFLSIGFIAIYSYIFCIKVTY